jgi:hypothetical protein
MRSIAARICIAVVLTVSFYLLALALAALLAFVVYAQVTNADYVSVQLIVGCCIGIAVILWSVLPRIDRFPDPGVRLHADRQPALWHVIGQVAAATAQRVPADVFLVGDVNAFVAQRAAVSSTLLPAAWRSAAFDHAAQLPSLTVADFVAQRDRLPRLATDAWRGEVMDAPARVARVRQVLVMLLGFRLHEAGFTVDALPGYPVVLRRGDRTLALLELLAPETEGGMSFDAWRTLCAEEGIGDLPLAGAAARPPTPM